MPLNQSLERSSLEFNCGIDVFGEFSGGHCYDNDVNPEHVVTDDEWVAMLGEFGEISNMFMFSERKDQAKEKVSGTALYAFLRRKRQNVTVIKNKTYTLYVVKLTKKFQDKINGFGSSRASEILWGRTSKW